MSNPTVTVIEETKRVTVSESNVTVQVVEQPTTVTVDLVNTIGPQGPQGETGPQGPEGRPASTPGGRLRVISRNRRISRRRWVPRRASRRGYSPSTGRGADYTKVEDAVTAAAAMNPSSSKQISLVVYPGTYTLPSGYPGLTSRNMSTSLVSDW